MASSHASFLADVLTAAIYRCHRATTLTAGMKRGGNKLFAGGSDIRGLRPTARAFDISYKCRVRCRGNGLPAPDNARQQ